jgi:ribosome-binding protein aMBF1 (putative translation factor)
MSAPTRHCHQCGTVYPLSGSPGRSETCEKCRADLHVCLNCAHYDARVAHQCRERRAEPVAEKAAANFCEYFEFVPRVWAGATANSREAEARERLRKLFGD